MLVKEKTLTTDQEYQLLWYTKAISLCFCPLLDNSSAGTNTSNQTSLFQDTTQSLRRRTDCHSSTMSSRLKFYKGQILLNEHIFQNTSVAQVPKPLPLRTKMCKCNRAHAFQDQIPRRDFHTVMLSAELLSH